MRLRQRFFAKLLGPDVEKESREWMMECPECGHADSVWERGGIRYKASGTKHVLAKCRGCGATAMLKVHRSR